MKNKKLYFTISILALMTTCVFLSSCANNNTSKPSIQTEIQQVPKDSNALYNDLQNTTPKQVKSDEELIEKALFRHYEEQFLVDDTNKDNIRAIGYKMYLIEDGAPEQKNAYGFASYGEYKVNDDGTMENVAGSGAAPVAISFDIIKDGTFVYEIFTDDELNSKAFTNNFPEKVRQQILDRKQEDIDEIDNMRKEMAKKLYLEKTGKEYTSELSW